MLHTLHDIRFFQLTSEVQSGVTHSPLCAFSSDEIINAPTEQFSHTFSHLFLSAVAACSARSPRQACVRLRVGRGRPGAAQRSTSAGEAVQRRTNRHQLRCSHSHGCVHALENRLMSNAQIIVIELLDHRRPHPHHHHHLACSR